MPRKTKCPCGRVIVVSDQANTRSLTCPKCGEPVSFEPRDELENAKSAPPRKKPPADSPPVIRTPVQLAKAKTSQDAKASGSENASPGKATPEKAPAQPNASANEARTKSNRDKRKSRKRRRVRAKQERDASKKEPVRPEHRPEADDAADETAPKPTPPAGRTEVQPPPIQRPPVQTDSQDSKPRQPKPSDELPSSDELPKAAVAGDQASESGKPSPQRLAQEPGAAKQPDAAATGDAPTADDAATAEDAQCSSAAALRDAALSAWPERSEDDKPTSSSKGGRKSKRRSRSKAKHEATSASKTGDAAATTKDSQQGRAAAAKQGVSATDSTPIAAPRPSPSDSSASPCERGEKKREAVDSSPEPLAPPPQAKPKPQSSTGSDRSELHDSPPVQTGEAVIHGVEHDADRISACYTLGAAMVFTAIFGVAPAAYQGALFLLFGEQARLESWALFLTAVCGLQFAYACYLMQAPDWSTAQVASYFMVALSASYAAALGAIAFGSPTGAVVRFLQIYAYQADHRASGWCFIMLLITGMIAYFGGRFANVWKQEETEIEL